MSKSKEFLHALVANDSVAAIGNINESLSEMARKSLLESQVAIAEKYGMKKVNEEDDEEDEYDSEDGDGDDKEDDEDKDDKKE
jgi:hypothetical protein